MKADTGVYQFDEIVINPADFQALRAGVRLEIEPKSFKVLMYLIENRERVVSKDELIEKVWSGTAVTDNALTRVIAQLRRELHDDARQPRYLETVPTVGYRFIGKLTEPPAFQTATHSEDRSVITRRKWALLLLGIPALVFGILLWGSKRLALQPSNRPPKIVQFTASPGLDLHPTFSPDGTNVAYASDRSGRFEIYVHPVASGGREVQITSDNQQNLEPAWSPDGGYIAYTSQVRRGILVVPALGGTPQRLTDFGSQPVWSPDGSQIAFRSEGVFSLAPIDAAPSAGTTIWLVSSKGGPARPLTRPNTPAGAHGFPNWRPDGSSLMFVSYGRGTAQLWSVRVPDGAVTRLLDDKIYRINPVYARDGRAIFYVSVSEAGFGVWRQPLPQGPAAEVLPLGFNYPQDLAFDRSGGRLAYSLTSILSNLYSVDANGSEPKPFVVDRSFRNTVPVFSPDGDRIAYLARRAGRPGSVWTIGAGGGEPTRLTQKESTEWLAGWLPDGKSVAYAVQEQGSTKLVATSIVDGTERTLVNLRQTGPFLRLSPDQKEVAYHQEAQGVTNVWKTDLATGVDKQITFDTESMAYPVWSPDGQWIAFEMRRGEDSFLSVMDRNGGQFTQLTAEPGHAWPHSWSPDGDQIAFAGLRDGAWNVWRISRSSREQKRLTNYRSLSSFVRYSAWSPRGTPIVFEYSETRGNIFLAELRR